MEIDRSVTDVVTDPTSRDAPHTTATRPRAQVPEDLDRGRPTPDLASAAAPGLSFDDGEALHARLQALRGELEGTLRVLDGVIGRLTAPAATAAGGRPTATRAATRVAGPVPPAARTTASTVPAPETTPPSFAVRRAGAAAPGAAQQDDPLPPFLATHVRDATRPS